MDGSQNIICEKNIIEDFNSTRKHTKNLIKDLYAEDMVIQTNNFVSPIKWHLGHTTWFFEKFILSSYLSKYKIFNKDFNYIFNSYYNSAGPFNSRERRGFLNRPALEDVLKYRNYVDENIEILIRKCKNKQISFLLELGINHEQQHQELILMDIKNIFYNNPLKPTFDKRKKKNKNNKNIDNSFILKASENYEYGHYADSFCYDNELPCNKIKIDPIKLKNYVTNHEWMQFIEDGGYNSHEYWLSDGWDFIKKNNINRPLYWIDDKYYFTLKGIKKIEDFLPVSHISFYEACAYAKYKKLRLPNEFEVEFFLKKKKIEGNLLEKDNFHEINYCNNKNKNMIYGNLWLWTSSNYAPYKNYKSYKNQLMEYNSKFMCNQFVLKGGSYGTPTQHIRSSYRNFYYPYNRWQFCGLRLVEDMY